MKLLFLLPTLLLELTNCTCVDWANVASTYFSVSEPYLKMAQDKVDWKNATPQERNYKLLTGEYPDPTLSAMMKREYKADKEFEKRNKN